jgi:CRISPR-associated exonuclease Cas4
VFAEDQLLPVSALQHFVFCPRQCALIHTDQVWQENRLTAEGRLLHERVHEAENESRGDVRIVRGLRLRSLALGVVGIADVVEFHRAGPSEGGVVPGIPGRWRPYPVEYKRGRPKPDECDAVQLCAQALCLEEMLDTTVDEGSIFYGKPRRRQVVAVDAALRTFCEEIAAKTRELLDEGTLPEPVYGKKCKACSLLPECMPRVAGGKRSATEYLASIE